MLVKIIMLIDCGPTYFEMCEVPMPPIVKRPQWKAKACVDKLFPLIPPVQFVAFTYDTGTFNCKTSDSCRVMIKKLQVYFIEKGLPDIPYNFCISPFGEIYEGRGFDIGSDESLENREYWGNRIDIAYIGDWDKKPPPQKAIDSAVHLVKLLVDREYVDKRFDILQNRKTDIKYPLKTYKVVDPTSPIGY